MESAEGDPGKIRAQAHALDAEGFQLVQRQLQARRTDQHVDRLRRHRFEHRDDLFAAVQTGRVEHIGAGIGVGAQTPQGVVEILATMQEVLRAGAEGERKWQRTGRLDRGSNPLQRGGELIDGLSGAPAGILDGTTDQTGLGGQADGRGAVLRSIAVAVFQVGGDRQIGGGDDRPGVFQRLSPAHRAFRVAPAQENARPALVVARASKPRLASIFAEPASQGLGRTSMPGPWCRSRKRSARWRWLVMAAGSVAGKDS